MNSLSRLSSLSDSRLQPLYPFRPLSEDNSDLLLVETPANNAGPADFLDGTDDCLLRRKENAGTQMSNWPMLPR